MTLKVSTDAIFAIVDLFIIIFQTEYAGMCLAYLHTKFYPLRSNGQRPDQKDHKDHAWSP